MFDAESARIIRSAPSLPSLRSEKLPELLTRHYAELVSERLRGRDGEVELPATSGLDWIADNYEVIASAHQDHESRKAAAFVAATAQQIIARRQRWSTGAASGAPFLSRDGVDPRISAVLLFLSAEQFADASEAAREIEVTGDGSWSSELASLVRNLGLGRLQALSFPKLDLANFDGQSLEDRALDLLLKELAEAICALARSVLSPKPNEADRNFCFECLNRVLELAGESAVLDEYPVRQAGLYPGPRHLASLLWGACLAVDKAALNRIQPPEGADTEMWERWIQARTRSQPYVWPNHQEFVNRGFYERGISAVLVLPTGGGKTTVSSLKIAACLAAGRRVVFLAPTHALVDQLVSDLQQLFPRDLVGAEVSSDSDVHIDEDALPQIEVMTPERCLASLCFSSARFDRVGLLVFDECHLLSPSAGSLRRSLDGMLCVLAFQKIVKDADLLFMSAMLENGEDFSAWIESISGRKCLHVNLLWKPSRQARGVIVYDKDEVDAARRAAIKTQSSEDRKKGKRANRLRAKALEKLSVRPYAIWGLRHNWLDKIRKKAAYSKQLLLNKTVRLGARLSGGSLLLMPNVNEVAALVASEAAAAGLKVIVFVNNRSHSVSTSRVVNELLSIHAATASEEDALWEALDAELGGLSHSLLVRSSIAVPHHAAMLKLERDLAERSYRRKDGARVIVATPTLAQGLNLPAQIAILAGDKRTDPEDGGRSELEAHEILNAAARAGRAGHLANGIVLLVPDPVLVMKNGEGLTRDVVDKLQAILPEDDRCVAISDPLELILDRLTLGQFDDRDVKYAISRLITFRSGDTFEGVGLFDISRSLAAFYSAMDGREVEFDEKVSALLKAVEKSAPALVSEEIALMSARSGLPIDLIMRLRIRVEQHVDSLPDSISGWVEWALRWLEDDSDSAHELLRDVVGSINASVGLPKKMEFSASALVDIRPGIWAWLKGAPIRDIELALGGDPDSLLPTSRICPRARELVGTVMPRGISYVMTILSMTVSSLDEPMPAQPVIEAVQTAAMAVRRGLDSPQKVRFALKNGAMSSRVQLHKAYSTIVAESDEYWSGLA